MFRIYFLVYKCLHFSFLLVVIYFIVLSFCCAWICTFCVWKRNDDGVLSFSSRRCLEWTSVLLGCQFCGKCSSFLCSFWQFGWLPWFLQILVIIVLTKFCSSMFSFMIISFFSQLFFYYFHLILKLNSFVNGKDWSLALRHSSNIFYYLVFTNVQYFWLSSEIFFLWH